MIKLSRVRTQQISKSSKTEMTIISEDFPVKLSVSISADIWEDIKTWTDDMKNSIT